MRISEVQNSGAFRGLHIQSKELYDLGETVINKYKDRLANTKHVDLIFDSHGFAIKKKMTGILQRVQSFSLFTQENSVGINMNTGEEKTYKFKFGSLDSAKAAWQSLSNTCRRSRIEGYTKIALMIDKYFATEASKKTLQKPKPQNPRVNMYY